MRAPPLTNRFGGLKDAFWLGLACTRNRIPTRCTPLTIGICPPLASAEYQQAYLRHGEMTANKGESGQKRRPAQRGKSRKESLPLSEQAYIAIKDRIITLFFAPGQYLNEASICEQLGMGRTPVHQALQRLQAEGLVDVVPRKGVIIQPDSMGQVVEILDARLVVEPEIAARAAMQGRPEDIAH
eukprot:gene21729-27647_t